MSVLAVLKSARPFVTEESSEDGRPILHNLFYLSFSFNLLAQKTVFLEIFTFFISHCLLAHTNILSHLLELFNKLKFLILFYTYLYLNVCVRVCM